MRLLIAYPFTLPSTNGIIADRHRISHILFLFLLYIYFSPNGGRTVVFMVGLFLVGVWLVQNLSAFFCQQSAIIEHLENQRVPRYSFRQPVELQIQKLIPFFFHVKIFWILSWVTFSWLHAIIIWKKCNV